MGLFSKKTVICEKCGKECQVRIALPGYICDECLDKQIAKENEVRGYINYARDMNWNPYTEEEIEKITEHRNEILEKYQKEDLILGEGKENLMKRTEPGTGNDEDKGVLELVKHVINSVLLYPGTAVGSGYFALTDFEKVVVDASDIFAVGFIPATDIKISKLDAYLCVLFTNDPYMPIFPMIYFCKKNFLDSIKGKKNTNELLDFFALKCPALKYPVQELKVLKNQIKKEGIINGNIDRKFMLEKINEAISGKGMFNVTRISNELSFGTIELLRKYEYYV